jgi:hypothetical protein
MSPPQGALVFPPSGAVRLHPEPQALPRLRHEGPGRNRFDDPDNIFLVRYAADTLRGCLVETLSRFRRSPRTDALLASIADDEDLGGVEVQDPKVGLADWLAVQKIGVLVVRSPDAFFVDLDDPPTLDHLDKHPRVREALDNSGLGTALDPARLDAGIIRLGGPVGRPITQAVSRAVYEWARGVDGVGYWSRLDSAERCWGIYDHVPWISPSPRSTPSILSRARWCARWRHASKSISPTPGPDHLPISKLLPQGRVRDLVIPGQ